MPAELKKGILRRNRSEQGRFDNESPCGNGWAWESIAYLLSSGNRNDICMAQALLESFDLNGKLKKRRFATFGKERIPRYHQQSEGNIELFSRAVRGHRSVESMH